MRSSSFGHSEGFKVIVGAVADGIWSSVGGPPVALLIVDALPTTAVESSVISTTVETSVVALPYLQILSPMNHCSFEV